MSDVTEYNPGPGSLANRVVGVPDYSKANAGKAAETLARGLGQIRNQVASNASQNMAQDFQMADAAIGTVGHAIGHAIGKAIRQNQIQTAQNQKMLANSQANSLLNSATDAMNQYAKQTQSDYQNNPEVAPDEFSSTVKDNYMLNGQPALQGPDLSTGQVVPQDIGSVLDRARQNPNIKAHPEEYYQLQDQLQKAHNSLHSEMTNWSMSKQSKIADGANDRSQQAGVASVGSATGNPITDRGAAIAAIVDTQKAIQGNAVQAGFDKTEHDKVEANRAISHASIVARVSFAQNMDQPAPALAQLEAIDTDLVNHKTYGMDLTPESQRVLHGYIETAKNAQYTNLENQAVAQGLQFRLGVSQKSFALDMPENRDNVAMQNSAISWAATQEKAADQFVKAINSNPLYTQKVKDRLTSQQVALIGHVRALADQAQANIRYKQTQDREQARHEQTLAHQDEAERRRAIADAKRDKKEAYHQKSVEDKQDRESENAHAYQLRAELQAFDPATQQKQIIQKAAELSNFAASSKHLTQTQSYEHQKFGTDMAKASAEFIVHPASLFHWTESVEHQSPTNDKEAKPVIDRQQQAVNQVKALQQTYQIQDQWYARAGQMFPGNEEAQNAFRSGVASIITKAQKDQIPATDWRVTRKIGDLQNTVVKTVAGAPKAIPVGKIGPNSPPPPSNDQMTHAGTPHAIPSGTAKAAPGFSSPPNANEALEAYKANRGTH